MRAFNKLEGEHISGGKIPVVDLPPVVVSPSPPPSGTGGGGIGLWGGGPGGPTPSPPPSGIGIIRAGGGVGGAGWASESVAEKAWENAAEKAIELAEAGTLGTEVSRELFVSTDYAKMAGEIGKTIYEAGEDSYTRFEAAGDTNMHDEPRGYDVVNWQRINWQAYDDDGHATSQQAIANLFHDVDVNHHVSVMPYSPY